MDTDASVFLFIFCVLFAGFVGYSVGADVERRDFVNACQHYKAYNTGKFMLICEVKR